jgi:hypothetical protein
MYKRLLCEIWGQTATAFSYVGWILPKEGVPGRGCRDRAVNFAHAYPLKLIPQGHDMVIASFNWVIQAGAIGGGVVAGGVIVWVLGVLYPPRRAFVGGLLGSGIAALLVLSSGAGDMGGIYVSVGVPAFGIAGAGIAALVAQARRTRTPAVFRALAAVLVWTALLLWCPSTLPWMLLRWLALIPVLPFAVPFWLGMAAVDALGFQTSVRFEGYAVLMLGAWWVVLCGIVAAALGIWRPTSDAQANKEPADFL